MIRLDAISIIGLPKISKAALPEPSMVRVNGVLQSEPLPAQQELEVRLNGEPLTGVREGKQQVFSWQWVRASDQVQMILRSPGPTQYWRASWDGRAAIVHTGTLLVQVVFDGKVQLPTEGARVNGSSPAEAPASSGGAGMRADLTLIAVAQPMGAVLQRQSDAMKGEVVKNAQEEREEQGEAERDGKQQEYEPESDEADGEDRWEDELEGDTADDDGDQWEDEEDSEDQGEVDEVIAEENKTASDAAQALIKHGVGPAGGRVQGGTRPPADMFSAPTWQVTTVHADPLAHERTLQSLRELVALRPKTLIVDVRPSSSPRRKKYQTEDRLSKQSLRSVFGAKYWDRGWAIACTSQMVPRSGRIRGTSWRYIVNKLESHPDGIPALEQKLAEGYALVVIDSLALYGESRRRAVVEELLRRVTDLTLGPLG